MVDGNKTNKETYSPEARMIVYAYGALQRYEMQLDMVEDELKIGGVLREQKFREVKDSFQRAYELVNGNVIGEAREMLGRVFTRFSDSHAQELLSKLETKAKQYE